MDIFLRREKKRIPKGGEFAQVVEIPLFMMIIDPKEHRVPIRELSSSYVIFLTPSNLCWSKADHSLRCLNTAFRKGKALYVECAQVS